MIRVPRRLATALAFAAAVGLAAPAGANDSSSELAAGGLVLTKTEAVVMQREDLTLAPDSVKVRYEFRNPAKKPVTLRVAFPLPEIPRATPGGMETSDGAHNINLRPPQDVNFLNFRLWVNGSPVVPEAEIRAFLPDGRDIAADLLRIGGTALALQPRIFELPNDPAQRAGPDGGWDLSATARQQLRDLGALRQDADAYATLWTTRVTFHWQQTFAPGLTVVEHAYRPILGSELIAPAKSGAPGEADEARGEWTGSMDLKLAPAFCIDTATDAAMRKWHARLMQERQAAGNNNDVYVPGYVLGYVLKTARNWEGPIGTFHLTLQGGQMQPEPGGAGTARLMSLCTDLPLRQTGPLQFEATVTNYVPQEDLRVLYLPD